MRLRILLCNFMKLQKYYYTYIESSYYNIPIVSIYIYILIHKNYLVPYSITINKKIRMYMHYILFNINLTKMIPKILKKVTQIPRY